MVRRVRERFPDIRLMADANSAYTLDDIEHLKQLDAFDLMMIEQPLAHDEIIDHTALQAALVTPICLDECIRNAHHARQAIRLGAAPRHQHQARPRGRLQRGPAGTRSVPRARHPGMVRRDARRRCRACP